MAITHFIVQGSTVDVEQGGDINKNWCTKHKRCAFGDFVVRSESYLNRSFNGHLSSFSRCLNVHKCLKRDVFWEWEHEDDEGEAVLIRVSLAKRLLHDLIIRPQ